MTMFVLEYRRKHTMTQEEVDSTPFLVIEGVDYIIREVWRCETCHALVRVVDFPAHSGWHRS